MILWQQQRGRDRGEGLDGVQPITGVRPADAAAFRACRQGAAVAFGSRTGRSNAQTLWHVAVPLPQPVWPCSPVSFFHPQPNVCTDRLVKCDQPGILFQMFEMTPFLLGQPAC